MPDGGCRANDGEQHQRDRHELRSQKDKARHRCGVDDLGDAGLSLAPHDLGAEQDRQDQQQQRRKPASSVLTTICVIGSSGVP